MPINAYAFDRGVYRLTIVMTLFGVLLFSSDSHCSGRLLPPRFGLRSPGKISLDYPLYSPVSFDSTGLMYCWISQSDGIHYGLSVGGLDLLAVVKLRVTSNCDHVKLVAVLSGLSPRSDYHRQVYSPVLSCQLISVAWLARREYEIGKSHWSRHEGSQHT